MKQYEVLQYGYSQLLRLLERRGKEENLFSLADENPPVVSDKNEVIVASDICDLCQLQSDKTGQRIAVDEALFDLPTIVVYTVGIHIYARSYARALQAAGSIIAFLKDTTVIPLEAYNWHGNTSQNLFIEPCVRNINTNIQTNALPIIHLLYKIESGINSERGMPFKRVEERDIRSKKMKST